MDRLDWPKPPPDLKEWALLEWYRVRLPDEVFEEWRSGAMDLASRQPPLL